MSESNPDAAAPGLRSTGWATKSVSLTPAVNRAVGSARAEIAGLLQAVEVFEDWRRDGCSVRAAYVFHKHDLARLILGDTPEPGVRNDGSYHPGKTLAPIEVAGNELEDSLLNQGVDLVECFNHRSAIRSYAVLLGEGSQDRLARRAKAEIRQLHEFQDPQAQRIVPQIVTAGIKDIVLAPVAERWAEDVSAIRMADGKDERHAPVCDAQRVPSGLVTSSTNTIFPG